MPCCCCCVASSCRDVRQFCKHSSTTAQLSNDNINWNQNTAAVNKTAENIASNDELSPEKCISIGRRKCRGLGVRFVSHFVCVSCIMSETIMLLDAKPFKWTHHVSECIRFECLNHIFKNVLYKKRAPTPFANQSSERKSPNKNPRERKRVGESTRCLCYATERYALPRSQEAL